jgi:hypothetical protein
MISDKAATYLQSIGIKFATVEDCARALLRIVADTSINGSNSLFPKIIHGALSLSLNIGRAFGILPRDTVKEGFLDMDVDDHKEGSLMAQLEEQVQLATQWGIVCDAHSVTKCSCTDLTVRSPKRKGKQTRNTRKFSKLLIVGQSLFISSSLLLSIVHSIISNLEIAIADDEFSSYLPFSARCDCQWCIASSWK